MHGGDPALCWGLWSIVLPDGWSGDRELRRHWCECGIQHEGMTEARGWGIKEFGQGEQTASELTHYSSGAEPGERLGPSFLQHRPLSIVKR